MKYKTIIDFIGAFQGANAIVIGTGPSLDYYIKNESKYPGVKITINRACLAINAEFNFFDTHHSLRACVNKIPELQRICIPIFALGYLSINEDIIQDNAEKMYFYSWDFKGWDRLSRDGGQYFDEEKDSILNKWKLFIQNGNVQSATIFAQMIGAKKIYYAGCDGDRSNNGRVYSTMFEKLEERSPRKNVRQCRKYKKAHDVLIRLLQKINMSYEFILPPSR